MKIYQTNQLNLNSVITALSNCKSLQFSLVLLTITATTISLIVPVIAQIPRPSQDFFNQGRDQVEREIQVLQESPNKPQNSPKKPEPILKISPTPDNEPKALASPSVTPIPTPDQMNYSR
jgi:hypothetical protein